MTRLWNNFLVIEIGNIVGYDDFLEIVVFITADLVIGIEKMVKVPYSVCKNAKSGGFLRLCGDFWVFLCEKMPNY